MFTKKTCQQHFFCNAAENLVQVHCTCKSSISVIKGHLFSKKGRGKRFNVLDFIQVKSQFRKGIKACAGNEVCAQVPLKPGRL